MALVSETLGFEPRVHVATYDGLANRCFRPLSHISQCNPGEGRIRTHGPCETTVFKTAALDHSATSPDCVHTIFFELVPWSTGIQILERIFLILYLILLFFLSAIHREKIAHLLWKSLSQLQYIIMMALE